MTTITLGKKTAMVSPTRRSTSLALTMDDTKVLGNYTKKLEKTAPPEKYKTRMLKTHNSNWTPVVHKPSNKQIFKERKELVSNWFDMWTDSQRKDFISQILWQCRRPQYSFIQNWFTTNVPLRYLDFTRVLPRFLSLRVFSYLDPRSLSRASTVCWHWKFLTEQDVLWQPKCARQGWYLPYSPASNEYGAWKKHYVACIMTLDMQILSRAPAMSDTYEMHPVYGGIGDGTNKVVRKKRLTEKEYSDVLNLRPPWLPPDRTPKDLEESSKALLHEYNPNDPQVPDALLKHHNRWGVLKQSLSFMKASRSMEELDRNKTMATRGLMSATRRSYHRGFDDDEGIRQTGYQKSLGEYLELATFEERRFMDLVNQPWEMSVTKSSMKGSMNAYPMPWKQTGLQTTSKVFPNQSHPRVIFMSSRVPAAEILVDAVLFGIIPIVYEYEGTSLQALQKQLETYLGGRTAQSIGFFLHSEEDPGELRIVHGCTMNVDNLDTPEYVEFWMSLTAFVQHNAQNGHVDFFVPLASCESGNELLTQLGILTGMTFTSPSGIIGNYNHVNSEWLRSGEPASPPSLYFCSTKLNVWTNTADQVAEACKVTKQIVGNFFQQIHKDVVSQLTGQLLFDAMSMVDIHGVNDISETLVESLVALGHAQSTKPLEFLGRYLLEKAGVKQDTIFAPTKTKKGETLAPAATMLAGTLSAHLSLTEKFDESLDASEVADEFIDEEVAQINEQDKQDKQERDNKNRMMTIKQQGDDSVAEEVDDESIDEEDEDAADKKRVKLLMKPLIEPVGTLSDTINSLENTHLDGLLTSRHPKQPTMRLTAQELAENPEKRTLIAREIMASEMEFVKTMEILQRTFYGPLKSALASNRAILSAHNLQVIFTDPIAILDVNRGLLVDLKSKLSTWDADECLGDVFIKFSSKLKAYTNYLNNYQTILTTVERCMEQSPAFRAFRRQRERTPDSKMLTLPELLLYPPRRISEYVTLLGWFHMYTPTDHADREDLQHALHILKDLNRFILDGKKRLERERELKQIQKTIVNCPLLLEANRYYLKQLDVAHLKVTTGDVETEQRVYQHVEMLGLYLFNDSLVVTRRTTHNFPFTRAVDFQYKFETCCSLGRLKVEDIADSKFLSNGFHMFTPNKSWVCKADTFQDKYNWMTLLENRINAHIS